MEVRQAWKLFRRRRDGTLGPLFIDRGLVIRPGKWMPAKDCPTKGYARRPGWHCAPKPEAPHLALRLKNGEVREWVAVEIAGYEELRRPESQGGTWFLAKWLRVKEKV
jgi:hypothetical protein